MKVKIGKYQSRLTCNIYTRYMERRYSLLDWPDEQTLFEDLLEKVEDAVQAVYNVANRLWFDERKQKVKVHIDPWDTWSMDHTLAHIILPMLKQLKETKHGSPWVDNEDVPAELRSRKDQGYGNPQLDLFDRYELDDLNDKMIHKRWDWVLDEMIWAFEQLVKDDWRDEYYGELVEDKDHFLNSYFVNRDREGELAAERRLNHALRLFGKYYQGLWD